MTYGELFAGAGGFSLGFEAAGMTCKFQVEIDTTARAVLARHWADVPRRDDVRECGKKNLARVDVLTFGFPCQDLSVAGQRKGLQGGTRSGLFYEAVRIGAELRSSYLLFENVPGLLSSDDGRDFARVLRHLGDSGFHGAWRVLDAQHFGLAQRRKRVFGVFSRGRFGAERCAEILALREGVRGHSATGREAGEGSAGRLAQCLRASGVGTERAGDTRGQDNVVVSSVTSKWAKGSGGPSGDECQNLVAIPLDMRQASRGGTMTNNRTAGSSGGAPGTGIGEDGDPCPTIASSHVPAVAHTLRGEGFDASEDGTGRGTPLIAFSSKDHGADAGELCPTLRAMGHTTSHANGGGQVAIAFQERGREGGRSLESQENLAYALTAPNGGGRGQERNIATGLGVRRLTPRECERLQGWPDDHTRYRADGSEIADGPRYRLIGNGVSSPVVEWIARRLVAA